MSLLFLGNYYNITDGKRYGFEGDECTVYDCELCYTDKYLGFFGGCFVVGLLGLALVASVIFMFWKVGILCKYWLAMCVLNIGDKIDGVYDYVKKFNAEKKEKDKKKKEEKRIAEKKRLEAEGILTSSDEFEAAYNPYAVITEDNFEEYILFKESQYAW